MSDVKEVQIPEILQPVIYGLMPSSEIIDISAVEVKVIDTYEADGQGSKNGLMDPIMGETSTLVDLDSDGEKETNGEFGHIALELPVIHTGFIDLVKTALNSTCNNCGRILLHETPGTHPSDETKSEQDYYREIADVTLKDHGLASSEYTSIINEIKLTCTSKDRVNCMHCEVEQEKIILDMPWTFRKQNSEGRKVNITTDEISQWLGKIPNNELIFIGLGDSYVRPEWAIMNTIPVPPLAIRPTIIVNEYCSADDLTNKLVDIVRINQRLNEVLKSGNFPIVIDDLHTLLQYHCTTYFDNQTSGIPPARHRSGRPLKTLAQRVKGDSSPFRFDFHRPKVEGSTGGRN
uniref:DNA-directed RNA polymerase subunit n=1 Tax=uncultured Poseidoniia archaeon TaxID=1697135 RepID=A0A1B1TAB7_9ARCH|nr:hypothetical protein [uncultured Candidatus Thalassoarchaea sp.]